MKYFLLLLGICLGTGQVSPAFSANAAEHLRDVIYTKHDGVALTMDVYKPANANGAGIIKIISGGWRSNHANMSDGGWPQAGYTTFVVVHGTQPRFQVEEIVADINRAVRFIRANASTYGVDPLKIGVTGSSAGGHLSLMLATRGNTGDAYATDPIDQISSQVQAVACFYPPTDYLNWFADGDNAAGGGRLAAYAGAFGPKSETPGGQEHLGHELSPIYWVNAKQPPVFIVHGDADPLVSVTQAYRFHKQCKTVGAICDVAVREEAGHGGWQEMTADTKRMVEWFDLHLLGKQPSVPFTGGITSLPSTPVVKPNILNQLTDEERANGWRLLFDGTSFAGWRGYGQPDLPALWEIHDGAITLNKSSPVGSPGAEGSGIVTRETFTNFDLRWEWRLAEGGNSGVMYHVSEEYKKPHETGPEYQLSDAQLHPDGKKSPLKWSGALYGMYAPVRDLAKPHGEWNRARIVVRGKLVEHWLNGEISARYELGTSEWTTRLLWGKWNRYPQYAQIPTGHICFQDHGHGVGFRNVKIKVLP